MVFSVGAAQPTVTLPCVEFVVGAELEGGGVEEAEAGFTVISNVGSVAEAVPSVAAILTSTLTPTSAVVGVPVSAPVL